MTDEEIYRDAARGLLVAILAEVAASDPSDPHVKLPEGVTEELAYQRRNAFIYQALAQAAAVGYDHGIQPDPAEPGRVLAYIDLPTGQVSWHLPCYVGEYDGHSTPEKYHRVREFEQGAGS